MLKIEYPDVLPLNPEVSNLEAGTVYKLNDISPTRMRLNHEKDTRDKACVLNLSTMGTEYVNPDHHPETVYSAELVLT
jgi:hypothetical protein